MAETAFREDHVDADGFRIRYMQAGEGVALVHLHGAGGLRLTPSHELLARRFRVVAFEMPGFGGSPVNTRTDPVARAKTQPLVQRLLGPHRDADLESRLHDLATPTLVLFGTLDRVIAPAMGRIYKDLMPNCHLVFVYDAGHAISTDRPEAFAEVTSDFLERHEAFVVSRAETMIHP